MKILRIRRGYTTNSSGTNEWVPPADPMYNKAVQAERAAGSKPQPSGFNPETVTFAISPTAKHVTILATQPQAAPAAATGQPPRNPARNDKSSTNLGLMGGLLGAVCLLFIATGVLRRIFRNKQ